MSAWLLLNRDNEMNEKNGLLHRNKVGCLCKESFMRFAIVAEFGRTFQSHKNAFLLQIELKLEWAKLHRMASEENGSSGAWTHKNEDKVFRSVVCA